MTTWIVESYDGEIRVAATDVGNTVTIELRGQTVLDEILETARECP
ncbi:MAG: hypothetical protein ABEH86_03930 [Haloarcula sp.]